MKISELKKKLKAKGVILYVTGKNMSGGGALSRSKDLTSKTFNSGCGQGIDEIC